MKRLLHVLLASMLALCALPAFASNHTGIDQWGHFTFHFQQMLFWLGQGQWQLAFYQADCTRDPLSKLLFVHGGAMWLAMGLLLFVTVWTFRKKIEQSVHERMWFYGFRQQRFA